MIIRVKSTVGAGRLSDVDTDPQCYRDADTDPVSRGLRDRQRRLPALLEICPDLQWDDGCCTAWVGDLSADQVEKMRAAGFVPPAEGRGWVYTE